MTDLEIAEREIAKGIEDSVSPVEAATITLDTPEGQAILAELKRLRAVEKAALQAEKLLPTCHTTNNHWGFKAAELLRKAFGEGT